MAVLYQILEIVNYIFIAIASAGFLFQLIYILFFWLKPKTFKKSDKYNRFAIIIPACNEEDVIGSRVKALLEKQTYPKECFDVFVCAHNCSDSTAKVARENGATVYELDDKETSHRRVSYAMKFILSEIMKLDKYDAFIRFDADNLANDEYIEKMNDAFNSGVEIARGFEASSNLTQNAWTKVSGTYYIRDSRIASNFRERAHMDSMLTGAGMMCSMKIINEIDGWDAMSMSEDAEFTINRLLEKKRVHYVSEAVVYEDQPSTFKDTFNRLTRMGHGLNLLFWKKGFKLFGKFFVTGRFSYIDLFMTLVFIPIALVCCVWFPLYYIYYCIVNLINIFGPNIFGDYLSSEQSLYQLLNLGYMILYVLVGYLVVYTFQTWLACFLSKKTLKIKSLKGYYGGIFLSPVFMVIWAIGISIGILTKPKWKKIKRNVETEKH